MKKFWNLMLAALVIIGAAACTENYDGIEKAQNTEGFSFYAEVVNDGTRAYIDNEDGDKTWNTVWDQGDKLIVKVADAEHGGGGAFEVPFECKDAAKGQFVSYDSNAANLQGQNVTITTAGTHHSLEGKKAFYTNTTINGFDNTKPIQLEAHTSFFRYTYNGAGDVKLTLTSEAFRTEAGVAAKAIEVVGKTGEQFVAFWPTGEVVTLSYSIDGVVCKSKDIALVAGKVYNLGELGLPYVADATWGIAGAFNGWAAGTPAPLYVVDNALVAFNLTKLNEGFKFVQNKDWDGAKGAKVETAVATGEWLYCGDKDIKAADASAYDVYFVPARSMYCLVAAGSAAPELPAVEPIVWSLAGSFNDWGDTIMTATDTANLFVVKGVELKSGEEIKVKDSKTWDTSYGGGINNLEANKWMKAYFNGSNVVVAKSGTYDVYFAYAEGAEYSKLYLIEANADYTAATEQTANGTLVPDGGDEPDQPAVTPGEASVWALVGAFSGWADKTMLTTTDADVVVLENVALKAAEGFLVRKPATDWADKYGAGNVNYIKANHYITTSKDGADMCLEADGTYDIYFNISTKNLYVMTAGTDYANATQQTVSGEEPKQEEPEVTEKVVYLKPNSNWKQSNARFAAYFFGGSVGEKWVSMTAVGDGTYEAHLPEGYDYGCNIIFARMNPSTTANNWNNKWNQTSDLKTPTDGKNLYTVNAGTWDKGGGTWSKK